MHQSHLDLSARLVDLARHRITDRDNALGGVWSPDELRALASSVTPAGLGDHALDLVERVILPSCLASDHPGFWAFIGTAPTPASMAMDALVGTSGAVAESWLEASGAVAAELAVLDWLCGLCGLPDGAGGVFVSGGTTANLAALAVARDVFSARTPGVVPAAVVSAGAHSSVRSGLHLLGIEAVDGSVDGDRVCAVVATAGTTNSGAVDDLAAAAAQARALGAWFHVDAAYGGAALVVPEERGRFAGIEHADSVVIDPHKWLFSPLDCGAVLYREPALALATHRQSAPYLDALQQGGDHNPADYAVHLTRRARGLPLWFSLAVHGTDAYAEAVRTTLHLARDVADLVRNTLGLELVVEPELSVVLVRRVGWGFDDYLAWSRRLLDAGTAFVVPTRWDGEAVARFAFVNPATTSAQVAAALRAMA